MTVKPDRPAAWHIGNSFWVFPLPQRASARQLRAEWADGSVSFTDPLPTELRRKLENYFDTDLSRVRIHVGSQPACLGAIALANRNDVYFAPGQYKPSTESGPIRDRS
ncbi:MAG: DUF4157 domain-containing protein [Verrucomicrobia bacterium]|nr:DUF4157 domain-containing protein [Verrucomicrobiota bacterium]